MVITAILGLKASQINVSNTFFKRKLEEKIYIEISEEIDIPDKENKALLLIKSLYNLQQSSAIWYQKFCKFLIFIEFRSIPSNNCIFINLEIRVILLVYVDDCLIFFAKKSYIKNVKIQ